MRDTERGQCEIDWALTVQRQNRRLRQEAHQLLWRLRFRAARVDVLGHQRVVGHGPEQAAIKAISDIRERSSAMCMAGTPTAAGTARTVSGRQSRGDAHRGSE